MHAIVAEHETEDIDLMMMMFSVIEQNYVCCFELREISKHSLATCSHWNLFSFDVFLYITGFSFVMLISFSFAVLSFLISLREFGLGYLSLQGIVSLFYLMNEWINSLNTPTCPGNYATALHRDLFRKTDDFIKVYMYIFASVLWARKQNNKQIETKTYERTNKWYANKLKTLKRK